MGDKIELPKACATIGHISTTNHQFLIFLLTTNPLNYITLLTAFPKFVP